MLGPPLVIHSVSTLPPTAATWLNAAIAQNVRIDEPHLSARATRRESISRRLVRSGWCRTGEAGFPAHGACAVPAYDSRYFRRTAFTEVFSSSARIRARSRISSSTVMVRFMVSAPIRTRHQRNTGSLFVDERPEQHRRARCRPGWFPPSSRPTDSSLPRSMRFDLTCPMGRRAARQLGTQRASPPRNA